MLTNKELLDLLGLKLNMKIVSPESAYSVSERTVEGCLAPAENGLETYVFYCHGTETKAKLSCEQVDAYSPIYSKERHMFVNRTFDRFFKAKKTNWDFSKIPAEIEYIKKSRGVIEPRIKLYRGSPVYINENGQLRFNFVFCSSTSYYSLCYKSHNIGAEALNKVGIKTASSIIASFT